VIFTVNEVHKELFRPTVHTTTLTSVDLAYTHSMTFQYWPVHPIVVEFNSYFRLQFHSVLN